MKPRFYQVKPIDTLMAGWNFSSPLESEFRSQMLRASTGWGKTFVFNFMANQVVNEYQLPVLVLTHREELLKQAAQKYWAWFGGHADVIKSGMDRNRSAIYKVASIPTLYARLKKKSVAEIFGIPPLFVIIDEVHHIKAKTWLSVINKLKECGCVVLGVTATPYRMDGGGFQDIFDRLVDSASVKELEKIFVNDPSRSLGLVPDIIQTPRLKRDLNRVKVKGGDYDNAPLNQMLNTQHTCQTIVDYWKANGGRDRSTIAFCTKSVKGMDMGMHERLAMVFRQNGISAMHLDGKTPDTIRAKILEAYGNKEIQVLTNIEIATEGFDVPDIGCTIGARKTKSLGMYIQMGGRGKRPSPGTGKESHVYMDFVGNVEEHGALNRDHEWSLEGVKKKPRTILIHMGGKMMTQDDFYDIPAPEGVPMTYEIIEFEGDGFRFAAFLRKYEKMKKQYKDANDAARVALGQWYVDVDHRPELVEMQAIARVLFPKKPSADCDQWARSRYEKLKIVTEGMDNCENIHQANKLIEMMEGLMVVRSRNRKPVPLPGYFEIKAKIVKMIQTRWLPDYRAPMGT